ncbi:MAG: murein biosynthesis integral membrane protein MurJ [Candidatus Buchananbacteria bacterium RIFCSPHIGHO2_02_FULL_38_8]|uniref:Probable lipid II flippase MurJ n=1 Tax=Candidatus Buchananbacteria bacterium RIFCSPHIGHO2_02_FULL_38_8 TaxID=1797538 RepID=A0A1G1Y6P6_9BACT|nr:MAG: murein biosynthesis integral membrane protein MurJ [Candidatus Buchananbacteria bacterium RIFCSPHIGHO2_02_FULL_38_8]
MIKKLFNSQTKTITSAAIIIGAASLLSRLLGVLRDRVLAGEFGAGPNLDMYYAAFRIPDMVFNLLVLGAISAGFIPVFTEYLKNKKKAWELVNIILNVLLLALILISGLLILIAPWLVKIIAPGFDKEQIAITADLTRIMFMSPIFLCVSGILGGILQSFKRFFIYSIAPILYNIGIIIGALFFVPFLGIYGLAWGVALGSFMHMIIQIPTTTALGYQYQWIIDLKNHGFSKILKMMVPRILGLVTSQINFIVITIIGSTLMAGSITIFNLANNLQSFPLGIFGVSFAIAVFPTLSTLAKKKGDFIHTLSLTARQILFFIIPTSALLIILRAQIVRIVLGSGLFDWQDTILTLRTLSLFSISLFAQALILLFARAFYALQDSKTPFYTGLISVFANIILALMTVEELGVAGLALAFSLSSVLNLVLSYLALHYKIGNLDGTKIVISTSKILVATFMLAIVSQATKYVIEPIFGTQTFIGIASQGIISASAGLLVYFIICWLLKAEELNYLIDSFKKRMLKKITPPVEAIEKNT